MPDGRGNDFPKKLAGADQYLPETRLGLGLGVPPQAAEVSEDHRRYLSGLRRRHRLIALARLALAVGLVALWETAARLRWIDPFIISQPSQIAATLLNLARDGSLWRHSAWTVSETVVGFTAGTLIGTLIAVALWWSSNLSRVLEPYIVVLNSVPKVALGPIFIVWLGNGIPAIIAMALAISVIVTILMVFTGFQEVDQDKIKLLRTFGATKTQLLRLVVLPASLPTIIGALKVNVGLSLVGTIVGEFLVSQAGLGFLIVYGGQVFKMSLIMASVGVLCLVSIALYYGVTWLERRFLGWKT
ncbi:MAG: ABC transporter permease [Bacillota bacterium]|nr:ABC transporter permease [Bacillota bacterium]